MSENNNPLPDNQNATQAEWDELKPLAEAMFQAARKSHYAHNTEAETLNSKNQVLGTSAAILAAISGASALSHLSALPGWETYKPAIETGQGVVALAAALLSTLQTRLNYSKLAEMHRHSAVEYGAIRRNLKTMFHMPLRMRDDPRSYFDEIQKELHDLASKSLQISGRVWNVTEKRLKDDSSSLTGN